MWSQNPLEFEDASLPLNPGDMGWMSEQVPPKRWELDSLYPISGRYSLHHSFDNDRSACDYFILRHHPFAGSLVQSPVFSGDSLSFTFRIRHTYNPSSGNNWQVAFLSEFDGNITDGIIAGVNFMGSDDLVKLWRAEEGEYEELCSSGLNYQEEIGKGLAPRFRICWQWDGNLSLGYAPDGSGKISEIASTFMDDLPTGRSVVIAFEYSSAQDRKLWIDELHLEGKFKADSISPRLVAWELEKGYILNLDFSEAIVLSDSSDFVLFQTGNPGEQTTDFTMQSDSVSVKASYLKLYFPDPLPNREPLLLLLKGIGDKDGNFIHDTLLEIRRNEAEWGDVVINEVMADPDPPVMDAFEEYLELLNRSEYGLNLEGWILEVGKRRHKLDESRVDLFLHPGGYIFIEPVSLSNEGGEINLFSDEGTLVHTISYEIPYDAPRWKKEGGWSLESPDPERVCSVSQLWEYSLDRRGGTPGEVNSVRSERIDKEAPEFLYFGYEPEGLLALYFSEMVQVAGDGSMEPVLNPGNYHAVEIPGGQAPGARLLYRFARDPAQFSRYNFTMPAVTDCSGNLSQKLRFTGGSVNSPGKGSVLINELMYDPFEGEAEYIELFNPGQHYIDIRGLGLNVTANEEVLDELLPLSDHSRIMGPGEYLVLTRYIDQLMDSYELSISGCWVGLKDLKPLPDGGGRIRLCDRAGNSIDEVSYGNEMHMELITDTRGISLERIDPHSSGENPQNWHSAASIEAYATPGRINSQTISDLDSDIVLMLTPRVISPDNDGFNDILAISPGIDKPGWVISLWITNPAGRPVRMLANNHVAGVSSQYTWDGRNDKGQMLESGFYVVHLRAYEPGSGARLNEKKAVGLHY